MPISYELSLAMTDAMEHYDYLMSLPRISEKAWDERYVLIPDDDGNSLVEHTPQVRACLSRTDPHYVWSQIDRLIVPGYLPNTIGWHITERPWSSDKPVVAVIDPVANDIERRSS